MRAPGRVSAGALVAAGVAAALAACGAAPASRTTSSPPSTSVVPPTSSAPAPAPVGSALCDDLRVVARPGAETQDEPAAQAAARVLGQVAGGSTGVLPADVEAGLRERADGLPLDQDRADAVARFTREQCG